MCGTTARQQWKTPLRSTSITRRHSVEVVLPERRVRAGDAGVGDQDVDAAGGVDHHLRRRGDGGGVGLVDGERPDAAAQRRAAASASSGASRSQSQTAAPLSRNRSATA